MAFPSPTGSTCTHADTLSIYPNVLAEFRIFINLEGRDQIALMVKASDSIEKLKKQISDFIVDVDELDEGIPPDQIHLCKPLEGFYHELACGRTLFHYRIKQGDVLDMEIVDDDEDDDSS